MKLKTLIVTLLIVFASCNSTKTPISNTENTIVNSGNSTAIIGIEGMACQEGCADTIQASLLQLDGVEKATISFEKAQGVVIFNAEKISADSILKTITNTKVKDYVYTIKDIEIKK